MNINYSINSEHAGKFIGLLVLGVLYSIENKVISIDEAEGFIFKPSTAKILREVLRSRELTDVIDSGCELENIADLIPDDLSGSIKVLIHQTLEFIRNAPEIGRLVDKEITVIK
ncbi:DUF3969 family protein [Salmonella enterica subsp. enterica]|nr:DUF3969 family protein [Salmonella enterica subsp. enterica]EDS6040474.1 DUF3969 family protein [Salmonella enterica subsp. enterica serovar Lexington]EGZ4337175.1 DUF3969 family protein [Salmonella enterica subsp. enterica serovar Texas]EDT2960846.1 DUF3969 family protein [Salmonella enterica subsp. enterica]EDW6542792.1 DUF3969 family protein [Salmonella enterica subsp. enterica]